jgi:hypothetical protein
MDEKDESLLKLIEERSKERAAEANDLISKEKRFWEEHFPEFEDIAILQQRCNSCGFAQDYHFPESTSEERKLLLEFAMDIGILITYIMMEAVRPRPNKKHVFDIKDSNKMQIEVDLLLGKKKKQAESWVKNAIGPIDIFQEFLKLPIVKKGLAVHTKEYIMRNLNPGLPEKMKKELLAEQRFAVPRDPIWSPHEMDRVNLKLTSTFYDIWPWTYRRLEDIKNKLPKIVDASYDTLDEARTLDEKYRKDGTYDRLKQRLLDKHAGKREEKEI